MYTMRNRVSHGYDKVDLEIIWKTIHSECRRYGVTVDPEWVGVQAGPQPLALRLRELQCGSGEHLKDAKRSGQTWARPRQVVQQR